MNVSASEMPHLETDRLLLRPFTLDDAPTVQQLAGDRDVADTTQNIPHPYEDGMAEKWIASHRDQWEAGTALVLAITEPADGLVGAIGLHVEDKHHRGELGYWIGKPFWNRGYATEAAAAVMGYGFERLGLNRVQARYLARNPASGRVMEKMGMQFEGILRQHLLVRGRFEDIGMYARLRTDP